MSRWSSIKSGTRSGASCGTTSGLSEPIGVCSVLGKRIDLVQEEIQTHYWDFKLTGDLVELRNLATVAELVVECASKAGESWPHEHRLP